MSKRTTSNLEMEEVFEHIQAIWPKFIEGNQDKMADKLKQWTRLLGARFNKETLLAAVDRYAVHERFIPSLSCINKYAEGISGTSRHTEQSSDPEFSIKYDKQMRRLGMVPLRAQDGGRWKTKYTDKNYCVKVNGYWMLKIDYCILKLGDSKVNQLLRAEMNNGQDDISLLKTVVDNRNFAREYRKHLDGIVSLARTSNYTRG